MPSKVADYLDQELAFFPDRIEVKETKVPVMMSWEQPIMKQMAQLAGVRRGDMLEIGFGMGISATELQLLKPRSHTIIEAHPQIQEKARQWAVDKPGVTVICGRWQDVLEQLSSYDGIMFDVFGGQGQREAFFWRLHKLLKKGGVASMWLGDDQDLPQGLQQILHAFDMSYRMTKTVAIPAHNCTYSMSNEFYVPAITHAPSL